MNGQKKIWIDLGWIDYRKKKNLEWIDIQSQEYQQKNFFCVLNLFKKVLLPA